MFPAPALATLARASASAMPDRLLVTGPAAVDARPIDAESGQPTGAAPEAAVLYDGPCSVIDDRLALAREAGGDAGALDADALARVPTSAVAAVEGGLELAVVAATFGPPGARVVRPARVARVERGRTVARLFLTWTAPAAPAP